MLKQRFDQDKYLVGSIVLGAVILLIHGLTLIRFPVPHGDEAWMASRAYEFIKSGNSFGSLDRGVLDLFDGYEYFNPWLSSAIQSFGLRLFGEPSLLAIRFISLVSGFVLLIAIYYIGSAFGSKQLGILSVAFTAFSWPFSLSAHFGRPDIIAATFGYAGLAVHLNNRKSNNWLSALAGLLTGLAFEVHPHAAVYIPTVLALFIWKYKTGILKRSDFWTYDGGVMVGLMVFGGLHILPAPQTYLNLSQIVFSESHIPPILTFEYSVIRDAFKQMALMVFFTYPQILIGLFAIYRMMKKRPPFIGTLLVLTGALLLSFTLLVRNKFLLYYAILYSPSLSLLLAALFNDFLEAPVYKKFEHCIRYLIVISILLLPMLRIIRVNSYPNYQRLQSDVNQAVEEGDVIMANQLYWFGLSDHTYYSWENIAFHRRYKPESGIDGVFRLLKPDLFIIDGQLANFISDEIDDNHYFQAFNVPKSELETFLDKFASIETIIQYENEIPIQIYRINWNQN